MRRSLLFLLPELVLLFFFVAPIFKKIHNAGTVFGCIVCFLLLLVTIFSHRFKQTILWLWQPLVGKIGLSLLAICVIAGILFCSVMSLQMGRAIAAKPSTPQTVVVLGCKVQGDTPSPMLTRRLEAALEYLEANENVMCVTTGGQGSDENIAEGRVMQQWLIAHGIDASRILVEDTSTDTYENLQNTAKILEENNLEKEIVIVTDGFHQYRASCLAAQAGLTASAYSAYTKPLYIPTYWVREWLALARFTVGQFF